MGMLHVAVPPGTLPGAALQLRGPEHEISVPVGHPLHISCSAGLHLYTPVPGWLPPLPCLAGFESATNSSMLVALGSAIFTNDPNFLAASMVESGILPASLEALLTQLMADGLDLTTPRVGTTALTEFAFDVGEVVDRLDKDNLPLPYLLTLADKFAKEGAVGLPLVQLQQTTWIHHVTVSQSLCCVVLLIALWEVVLPSTP